MGSVEQKGRGLSKQEVAEARGRGGEQEMHRECESDRTDPIYWLAGGVYD
jgi:hypothetical protein